jgi:hypothetical protein
VGALSAAAIQQRDDPNFINLIPTVIDIAEQRCYRELDLLAAIVTVSGTLTANSRFFTLPTTSGHLLTVTAVNVLDATNTRNPLRPVSRAVIDFTWPSETASGASVIPWFFARISDTQILVGSAPGTAWTAEIIGTIRPTPLSAANATTFLTSYLPDLFFAASMVAIGDLLKSEGNPIDSQKWEANYQAAFGSAKSEELRKNFVTAISSPAVKA